MPFEYPQLSHPPIKEAIFTIAFKDAIDLAILEEFCNTDFIKNNFAVKLTGEVKFSIGEGGSSEPAITKASTKPTGHLLRRNSDSKNLIRLHTTFFSFHYLEDYNGWDSAILEFKELIRHFCTTSKSEVLTKISVRYVNEIEFSMAGDRDISKYVQLYPNAPDGIGDSITNFFLQIIIPDTEHEYINGIVTSTIANKENENITLILDINVANDSPQQCKMSEVWNEFDAIRAFKNKIFYSIVNDKTLENYK